MHHWPALCTTKLRCAPWSTRGTMVVRHFVGTGLCCAPLHCAPSACVVHHQPALCTLVHKGDLCPWEVGLPTTFFICTLHSLGQGYIVHRWPAPCTTNLRCAPWCTICHVHYKPPLRWCTMWCCQSSCPFIYPSFPQTWNTVQESRFFMIKQLKFLVFYFKTTKFSNFSSQ